MRRSKLLVRATDRVVGDRGGDVEDAVAADEGGAEGGAVEDVGAAQGETLLGAVQSQQVRVLAVLCASARNASIHPSIQGQIEFSTVSAELDRRWQCKRIEIEMM